METSPARRESLHVEPRGIREMVAGVEGGSLVQRAVLVVGFANLLADALSMGRVALSRRSGTKDAALARGVAS